MAVDLAAVAAEAEGFVSRAPAGAGLSPSDRALIMVGLAATPSALSTDALPALLSQALVDGADEPALVEVLMLVAGVGLHAVHEGVLALNQLCGTPKPTPQSLATRHRREGSARYWSRLERELPGFLDGLSARAPWAYDGCLAFTGAAARHGRLTFLQRELIWAAVDATPSHRYVPGLRLHLENALGAGATQQQLLDTLRLAAAGPAHEGVGRHATASA